MIPELSDVLAVDARGLAKRYGSAVAVNSVDLSIGVGSIHGLLGPNGAGKTTVLAMLFGLVPPDAGDLSLFGCPAARPDARAGIAGFVESPRFYPYLDARANLSGLGALDGGVDAGRVDEVLASVQLDGHDGEKLRGYSLGMRQRLGLAAALMRNPRLLVVDEPANGLDPAGMRDLRTLLRRLAGDGMTVLLSSHDMREVEDLCDHVTVLRRGAVAFGGTMADMWARAPQGAYRISTSDDAAAVSIASGLAATARRHDDGGLVVRGAQDDVDCYVIALGRAGVAVRDMSLAQSPLESLFFSLTEGVAA